VRRRPYTTSHTCRSPPDRACACSKMPTTCSCSATRGLSVVLRVRINSLGTDERILEWRGGRRRPAHVHRSRGDTDADAPHGGASGSLGALTLGEWVTLAFTYNAGDGQTRRSTRASWWRCSRPCRPATSFSTIELAAARVRWREHVAMWPHKLSDVHVGRTYSWAYTTSVRAHLKASPPGRASVDGAGPRRTRRRMGPKSADGQALMTKRTRISSPLTMRKATSCSVDLSSHTIKLEGSGTAD
jgi:hypothetical protein